MRTDWPGGAQVAVSLTFDVDAESGLLGQGAEHERRLSAMSEARYSVTRGVPRILGLLENALAERRHVTYTMHPEVIGRGHRADVLERLIGEMRSRGDVWFATHAEVAEWVR